jgi:hypothetical protein
MKKVINLDLLKKYLSKATAIATVISIMNCLIPDVAEAIPRLRFAGRSTNLVDLNFDIDLLAQDQLKNDESKGRFLGAIQDIELVINFDSNLTARFAQGDLSSSLFATAAEKSLEETLFPNGGIVYEAMFDQDSAQFETDRPNELFDDFKDITFGLSFFIPSTDPGLVNSLSPTLLRGPLVIRINGETENQRIEGNLGDFIFSSQIGSSCNFGNDGEPETLGCVEVEDVPGSPENIPEPATALGLLGLGALGTARSLLKRKLR